MKRHQETASLDPNEIMTLSQVAEYLHAHPSTIYRLAKKGRLPAFRLGSEYRFIRSDLEAWVAQQEREAAEEPASVTGKRVGRRPRKRAK